MISKLKAYTALKTKAAVLILWLKIILLGVSVCIVVMDSFWNNFFSSLTPGFSLFASLLTANIQAKTEHHYASV